MINIAAAVKYNLFNTGRFRLLSQKFTNRMGQGTFSLGIITSEGFVQG